MTPFSLSTYLDTPQDNLCDEALFNVVLTSGPQAWIWQGKNGLVVPRTYAQNAHFLACQELLTAQGWPLSVRQSGGGVVPQGNGIWNISLAWRQYGKPLDLAESAYTQLCAPIQAALADCGQPSNTQAVHGSFCDGRFNLAVQHQGQAKKIVGTAQVWRRCDAPAHLPLVPRQAGDTAGWHVVLAHALILIDVDASRISQRASEVEKHLGRSMRYQPQRICDLHRLGIKPLHFLTHLQTQLAACTVVHDLSPPSL